MVDIGRATQKWQANAARAGADYAAGVSGKGGKWQQNAVAAEANYAARIQEAIAAGRRAAGINATGGAVWEQQAKTKGAANFSTGVQNPLAGQKYGMNFGPILSAIQSALGSLPPRGAAMSSENMARAQAIWAAAHNAAQARMSGGSYRPSGY